jgi:hypothetical protein
MKFGCDDETVSEIKLAKKPPKEGAKCYTRRCQSPPAFQHAAYCEPCGKAYADSLRAKPVEAKENE